MSLQEVLSVNRLTTKQLATTQTIDIVSWANESRNYLDKVYSIQGHKINDQYIDYTYPIIEKQLLYAGLRLAAVLEKYFGNIDHLLRSSPTVKTSVNLSSTTITPDDAASHIGETLTISGKVYGGKFLGNSTAQQP